MNITNLTSESLRRLIKLTDRKDSILTEIDKIDLQLRALIAGKTVRSGGNGTGPIGRKVKAVKGLAKKVTGKRTRGGLQSRVLSALQAAGAAGIKVPELAKKLGVKGAGLHVWFGTTGKKHAGIKKVGKGHYKLVEK